MARRRPKPSSRDDTVRTDANETETVRVEEKKRKKDGAALHRKRIGPYQLLRVLGAGGMGVVYAAQGAEGREVAVKVLNTRDPEFTKRFAREAKIRIDSAHVVQVLGSGEEGGVPYIVFELLEGQPVAEVAGEGPIAPARAVEIGFQALAGLAAVHAAGIVHRDVKPANLFLCADGTVKLLDFGIAMIAQVTSRLTQSGGVIGTPSYLSPEQACGDPDIDETTDLWSLGVVLYELLSGETPFHRNTPIATLLAIVRDPVVPLRDLAPDVPRDLAMIVERALEKERSKRWRSAIEFMSALREIDPTTRGASRIVAPAIAADEQRVVAVLLADRVIDVEVLRAAVEARGGAFVPLVGSRALGLFGGEKWEGDEVKRAVSAAMAARAAAESVAVASGRAAGSGGGISGEALAMAEAGCAHRLKGVAIDAASARTLDGVREMRAIEGRIFELLAGKDPSASQFHGTPLLGREAELSQMRDARDRAFAGGREAVVAIGPPGIGKSRLLLEMDRLVHEAGATPFVGRGEPVKRDVSFSLMASILGSTVDPDLSQRAKRHAIVGLVRGAVDQSAEADRTATFISALLDVEVEGSIELDAARKDPRLMADRLRLALLDLLAGIARDRPLVLIADDLQWADDDSLDLLEALFDELDGSMLVFGTARSEFLERRPSFLSSRALLLEPRGLVATDVAKLARALTGRVPPAELVEAVAERTEGNPLFVEQILLALEEQQLGGTRELPLPLTVEAAIQSRLDHLPSREKNLLKRASIFLPSFTLEEVDHLVAEDAKPILAQLLQRGLLAVRSRGERMRRYRFLSSLVQDVAYRMLGDELRRELHLAAAEYLSREDAADPEDVGRHWELGGDSGRAAEWFAIATSQAARRGDNQSVLRCSDRAAQLGAPTERLFAVHLAKSEALLFLGRKEEQKLSLETALRFAATEPERAAATAELGWWWVNARETEKAFALLDEAIRASIAAGDSDVRARALGRKVVGSIYAGQLDRAEQALLEAEAIAGASPATRALLAGWRGQLASAKGDPGARSVAFAEAAARYEAVGDVRRAAAARTNLADAWNRVGAYAEAEDSLRRALIDCRRVGHRLMEGYALLNLGYACMMQGKVMQASAALDDCAAIAKEIDDKRLQLWCRIYHARAQLGGVSPISTAEVLEGVAREAADSDLPGVEVGALWVAARALLAAGDVDGAIEQSRRALARRDEIGGAEEDDAEVFLTAVVALEAAGRKEEAREVRQRGRDRVETIARRIADDGFRKRFLEEVPAHRTLGVDVDVTKL
jgi:tetratricopeptide (TPR) repeat protein